MNQGGVFVTLYDEQTLRLYLEHGVYGQHLTPERTAGEAGRSFYGTLADYSCTRGGTHVFFFVGREIYYGGQIEKPNNYASFYLNGQTSQLGRNAGADLVWDESDRYIPTGDPGEFYREKPDEEEEIYCQPFLIQFEPTELTGSFIISDQLYRQLSRYRTLLPSNSITGAGFCTLTPGETQHLLDLLEEEPAGDIKPVSKEDTEEVDFRKEREMTPFEPEYGISRASDATSELHLEGSLAANPQLAPPEMRPNGDVICRQVPLTPPKPELGKSDREDLCYYDIANPIRNGTVPNTIIELKTGTANYETAKQIVGYLDNMCAMFGDKVSDIKAFVYAERFTDGTYTDKPFDEFVTRYEDQIHKRVHDKHFQDTTDLS